ncbi:MAG: hypothetical protein ACRD2Z_17635 [Thermoanaerobaculia bacterium]
MPSAPAGPNRAAAFLTDQGRRFDRYVCRQDDGLRGRRPGEVPEMLAAALREAGVDEWAIDVIPEEPAAVNAALRWARKDDLLLVFGDQISRTWKQIVRFRTDGRPEAEVPMEATPAAAPSPPPPPIPDLGWAVDDALIRDERGVRLARETED